MEDKKYNIKYTNIHNFFVTGQVRSNFVVLDVGCWTGGNGFFLIKDKNCIVDGIDYDDKSLEIAKNNGYRNVCNLNLNESYNLNSVKNNHYDCIILSDILEHLIYPEKLLLLLKNKLKDDGFIIISVPNIAFILYRLELFIGNFEYNKKGGVMDVNHLRFFTKKTIKQLCIETGYSIEFIKGYSLVKDKYFFLRILSKIFQTVFALQFLIKIKADE